MGYTLVHLSDTHLGFSDLEKVTADGVNCREQDFYDSFRHAVDIILDTAPDAVVHTGDFFHRPSPGNRPMIEGLAQLRRISDAGIPFIVIAGNHSTPRSAYTSPILKALQSFNNVVPMFSQRYETVELNGIVFHGVPHINDDRLFTEEMKKISPTPGKNNILMLHASLGKEYIMEEFGERIYPPAMKDILKEFSYIALGHWHGFQHIKNYGNAWYAGSTERLSDREAEKEKGVVIVTLHDGDMTPEVTFHPIPARPWYRIDIVNCNKKTIEDIEREVREFGQMREYSGALVNTYFHDIKPEQSVYIKNSDVAEVFSGALSVVVRRVFQKNTSDAVPRVRRSESLDVYFRSYLRGLVPDDGEFGVLSEKAQHYFDMNERGE
ncbi:MAG TPA: exonuclease SbcCD subunit D [Spirochaetota bacterium]|nr:exonuclease SbcCD subunit D [Spirochaetota bacterium]